MSRMTGHGRILPPDGARVKVRFWPFAPLGGVRGPGDRQGQLPTQTRGWAFGG
jgi:hypothetical protein